MDFDDASQPSYQWSLVKQVQLQQYDGGCDQLKTIVFGVDFLFLFLLKTEIWLKNVFQKNHRSSNWNKLAKLWDAIAISKSETINHSLTHWLTHWQGELLGDAIASNNYQIVSMVEHRAGTIALMECRQTIDSMDKKPLPWKIYWRWIHPYNYYVQCLCNIVQVQHSIEMSAAILALAL